MPTRTIVENEEKIEWMHADSPQEYSAETCQNPSYDSDRHEIAFRPKLRRAQALLTIFDDGKISGEVIRLRSNQLLIGRTEGNLRFPNDEQISSRHVSIRLHVLENVKRWVITDERSRNGLFVRIGKAQFEDKDEILVGSGRYRFNSSSRFPPNAFGAFLGHSCSGAPLTRVYGGQTSVDADVLSEILISGIGARYLLQDNHYWIGRNEECMIRRAGDYSTKGQHALLSRSSSGTWVVQNNRSLNGVWLKTPSVNVELGSSREFQIGEQRFRFQFGDDRR